MQTPISEYCTTTRIDDLYVPLRRLRFCQKVLELELQIVAEDFPTFLYDESLYDPEDLSKGLLRGPFLLAVCLFFSSFFTLTYCLF